MSMPLDSGNSRISHTIVAYEKVNVLTCSLALLTLFELFQEPKITRDLGTHFSKWDTERRDGIRVCSLSLQFVFAQAEEGQQVGKAWQLVPFWGVPASGFNSEKYAASEGSHVTFLGTAKILAPYF
jgi:hypothetical protein